MTDKKQEQPKAEAPADLQSGEQNPLDEIDEFLASLSKMKTEELIEKFQREFFQTAAAAVMSFERFCLRATNKKALGEAAKYFLNYLKSPDVFKGLAIMREFQSRTRKGTAGPDNKATWLNETKSGKG